VSLVSALPLINIQSGNTDRLSTCVRIQFFPETADELRLVPDGRKHTAEEEEIAGLYSLDIGAERSGRRREFDAELVQSALRVTIHVTVN
jgi:hypothetical protein